MTIDGQNQVDSGGKTRSATPRSMRLARYLARCGIASRRRCEAFIRAGRVTVDGRAVTSPACNVFPDSNCVRFDGEEVTSERATYILLNKPRGYTCSASDRHARHLVFELLPDNYGRLFTVGRLDRDSEGVLLCTNDGKLAQRLAHPSYEVSKTYRVDVGRTVSGRVLARMEKGLKDSGEWLQVAHARNCRGGQGPELELILHQGRKREIRRLCARCGLQVRRLRRIRFGPLTLEGLSPGQWRLLREHEVKLLCMNGVSPGNARSGR